jgi:hypothetical protein
MRGAIGTDRPAGLPLGCRLLLRLSCSGLQCPQVGHRFCLSRPSSEDRNLPAFCRLYAVGAAPWDNPEVSHAGV